MKLNELSDLDKTRIGEALRAAAEGPFFPDWEFATLFGLERNELKTVAEAWPRMPCSETITERAIKGSLNNLVGYPHSRSADWDRWISATPETLYELLGRLGRP